MRGPHPARAHVAGARRVLFLCLVICQAHVALAQDGPEETEVPCVGAPALCVDAGIEQVAEADFEGALATFARADGAVDLPLAARVRLHAHRALAHFALGDTVAMSSDLERLAVLDPVAELPPSAPPQVWRELDRIRLAREEDNARERASSAHRADALLLSASPPPVVEPAESRVDRDTDDRRSWRWWVVAGAALLAAAGGITAAVLTTQDSGSQPSLAGPTLSF